MTFMICFILICASRKNNNNKKKNLPSGLPSREFWTYWSVADLEKNKRSDWIGMDSTGRWSNGLGTLNEKCHYEYQEMTGWIATLFTHTHTHTRWRRKRRGGGGAQWYVCAHPPTPPLLTPHFHFPLELYVYITLINNYLGFFIYQLIILLTVSINWQMAVSK